MATLNMVYKLKANATGMNMPKNQQNFFLNLEKQRGAQNTIKNFLLMKRKFQTRHPLQIEKKIEIRVSYKTGYSFLC